MLKHSLPLMAILVSSIILITAGQSADAQMSGTSITGIIFSDTNGNGVQDAREPGISGYDMIAIDYATRAVTTATTDDTGMYTFENVAPAPATTLVQAGYFPSGTTVVDPSTSWYRYITPQENSTVTFDVGFYPVPPSELTHLRVTVYEDANRNGTRDSGETGIPNLEMIVYTYTSGGPILTTNTSGMITANPVPADFLVGFYNPMAPPLTLSAPAGYTPTAYNYERSDVATTLGMYNPNELVADEPAPNSMHTMEIGLASVSINHAQLASTVKIDSADIKGTTDLPADTSFGTAAAGIGDIDGDKIPDAAFGAPGIAGDSIARGDLYIMFMNQDGTARNSILIDEQTLNGPAGLQPTDRFGESIAKIGDIDGDGVDDMAVGAPGYFTDRTLTGSLYILFMNSDGTIKNTQVINGSTPNGPDLELGERFGSSVTGIGDLNGDGTPDIAVGAPGISRGDFAGRLFVIFMSSDGTVKNSIAVDANNTSGLSGLQIGDRFGESMAEMGDLDGDAVVDLAVGAPGSAFGGMGTGNLYLLFLNADGTVKDTLRIGENSDSLDLVDGVRFGWSVANMGDIDGDDIIDLAVGASGQFAGPHTAGNMYLLFLNSDGSVKNYATINADTPNGPLSVKEGDHFGWSAANMGDLDNDGIAELQSGSYGADAVYVMFLNSDGTIRNTVEMDSTFLGSQQLASNDRFGDGVAGIGDLDGDGIEDIAVGAPGRFTGGSATGDLFILFMNSDGTVRDTAEINSDTPNGPALESGYRFGEGVARIGDLDDDGIEDIAVGAPNHFTGSLATGDLFILFMNSDGTVKNTVEINAKTSSYLEVLRSGDRFGEGVAGIGDLDGDGIEDIAVGAPGHVDGPVATGDLFILFMNSDGTVKNAAEINAHTPNVPALGEGDRFGSSVANMGDLNGDGVTDIAVGAAGHSVFGSATGDLFILFMNSDGTVKNTTEINASTANGPALGEGDRFGSSVANMGDLNGDGVNDIAVGAPGHVVAIEPTGDLYVILMNADGTVKETLEINSHTPNGPALVGSDHFGWSVANIGDLDDNGAVEIAIGAPSSTSASVYIAFMSP